MSLVGIDVGSSSVKSAAYDNAGRMLGESSAPIAPIYPAPGLWETDPEQVWTATSTAMRALCAQAAIKDNPPTALAVSASGRENFPADKAGNPLGNGFMGADTRGSEFELLPAGAVAPEEWCLSCGHLRERMDPVFRLAWWRKYHPEIIDKAGYFFGWIDFLTFRMTGQAVMDESTASRYAVYDLHTRTWSAERVKAHDIPAHLLPTLQPWGTIVGEIRDTLAAEWGLPSGVKVAQGCHDLNCAAYGAGVADIGTVCLVSGSYENVLVITARPPTKTMLLGGLSVMPQPCTAGLSVIAVHPTGNAVLNWARQLLHISIETMDNALASVQSPSSVMAIPYLSGAMAYWEDGRKARGGLLGMTLATTATDIVQALMESIAYDTTHTLGLMRQEGIPIERIRIMGGGARSHWWTQLKADVNNLPIEVVAQPEPGTFGAALLAGVALGLYPDVETATREFAHTSAVFTPQPERAALHRERMSAYHNAMATLLRDIY